MPSFQSVVSSCVRQTILCQLLTHHEDERRVGNIALGRAAREGDEQKRVDDVAQGGSLVLLADVGVGEDVDEASDRLALEDDVLARGDVLVEPGGQPGSIGRRLVREDVDDVEEHVDRDVLGHGRRLEKVGDHGQHGIVLGELIEMRLILTLESVSAWLG